MSQKSWQLNLRLKVEFELAFDMKSLCLYQDFIYQNNKLYICKNKVWYISSIQQ